MRYYAINKDDEYLCAKDGYYEWGDSDIILYFNRSSADNQLKIIQKANIGKDAKVVEIIEEYV